MTDDQGPTDVTDADRRVVEFLRTADRPRLLASEVATALDVPRGRVRTRLQALADDGRVVRVDDGTTARWAVPDRTDEPEPGSQAGTGDVDAGGPDVDDAGPDAGRDGAPEGTDADGVEVPGEETADGSDGTADASATAAGPTDAPRDRPAGGDSPPPSRGPPDGGGEPRWSGLPTRRLTLATGLVLALAVLRRLRRG